MATPDTTLTRRRTCRLNRRASSVLAISGVTALALAVTGNAFAGGSDPLSDSPAGLPDVATAVAEAAPVAETGTPDSAVSGTPAGASSEAPNGQPASSGEAPSLEAATQQAATAVANAAQNNVYNIVVIIRINSPGDDVISQSNTAAAGAVATNTATTQQGVGEGASSDPADRAGATGPSGNGTSTGGTPPARAQSEPSATTPAVPRLLRVATPAPERTRPRVVAVSSPSGDRAGASHAAAGATPPAATQARTASEPNQVAAPQVAPRQATLAAQRSASTPSARTSRPSVTPVPARIERAAARAGTGAAHFVSRSLAATPAIQVDKADEISTAVIVALLAVVLAVLLGVGSTYVPTVRARVWR